MINLYYGLKYPDGRLVGFGGNGVQMPVEHISQAYVLEANDGSLRIMKGFLRDFEKENLKLVILKIQEMPIKVSG